MSGSIIILSLSSVCQSDLCTATVSSVADGIKEHLRS